MGECANLIIGILYYVLALCSARKFASNTGTNYHHGNVLDLVLCLLGSIILLLHANICLAIRVVGRCGRDSGLSRRHGGWLWCSVFCREVSIRLYVRISRRA
ncbi:hypothetical protein BJ508DRAFT_154260 [Ascobolus immersus RN42]|uniref:Uncharacterized protein n=1 Tax=Ascobolus immersus RN42 TaxID=1160509 RepID=A0A3N4HXJ6_ASCIM|nr:hypothetical protein BJ508DRAFT_154260 [Ascobolus immersus RN42]